MIIGIGLDLVEIQRIRMFVDGKTEENLYRVFTENEYRYALSSINIYERLAVRFAAKEAFFKAFGKGIFREIEVSHDDQSKPHLVLYGTTEKYWKEKGSPQILLSLSHSNNYASAVVIIQALSHT